MSPATAPRLASVQLKPANQEDLVQPSATIATHAADRAKLHNPAVVGSIAALIAVVLISSTAGSNVLDWLLVIDGFVAASWWALSGTASPTLSRCSHSARWSSPSRRLPATACNGSWCHGRCLPGQLPLRPRFAAGAQVTHAGGAERSDEACS